MEIKRKSRVQQCAEVICVSTKGKKKSLPAASELVSAHNMILKAPSCSPIPSETEERMVLMEPLDVGWEGGQ